MSQLCASTTCTHDGPLTRCVGPALLRDLIQHAGEPIGAGKLAEIASRLSRERGQDCLCGPGSVFHQLCMGRADSLARFNDWHKRSQLEDESPCAVILDVRHFACNSCLEYVTGGTAVMCEEVTGGELAANPERSDRRTASTHTLEAVAQHEAAIRGGVESLRLFINPEKGEDFVYSPLVDLALSNDPKLADSLGQELGRLVAAVRELQRAGHGQVSALQAQPVEAVASAPGNPSVRELQLEEAHEDRETAQRVSRALRSRLDALQPAATDLTLIDDLLAPVPDELMDMLRGTGKGVHESDRNGDSRCSEAVRYVWNLSEEVLPYMYREFRSSCLEQLSPSDRQLIDRVESFQDFDKALDFFRDTSPSYDRIVAATGHFREKYRLIDFFWMHARFLPSRFGYWPDAFAADWSYEEQHNVQESLTELGKVLSRPLEEMGVLRESVAMLDALVKYSRSNPELLDDIAKVEAM